MPRSDTSPCPTSPFLSLLAESSSSYTRCPPWEETPGVAPALLSIPDRGQVQHARARSVHLQHEDALPGAEDRLPLLQRQRDRAPQQDRRQVGLRVVVDVIVPVAVLAAKRVQQRLSQALEVVPQPCLILVDAQRAGGVAHADVQDPVGNPEPAAGLDHLFGDIDDLGLALRLDLDLVPSDAHPLLSSPRESSRTSPRRRPAPCNGNARRRSPWACLPSRPSPPARE